MLGKFIAEISFQIQDTGYKWTYSSVERYSQIKQSESYGATEIHNRNFTGDLIKANLFFKNPINQSNEC